MRSKIFCVLPSPRSRVLATWWEEGREGGRGELEKRGYVLLTNKRFVQMPVHISL